MIENFKSSIKIQIRYGDTDALGHINNANYLSYMEVARINYFNNLFDLKIDWEKEGFILAKAEINYRKPIYLTDNIEVFVRVSRFGTKSFDMEYVFVRTNSDDTKEIVAIGLTIQVTMNFKSNTSTPVPEKYKKIIEEFEA